MAFDFGIPAGGETVLAQKTKFSVLELSPMPA